MAKVYYLMLLFAPINLIFVCVWYQINVFVLSSWHRVVFVFIKNSLEYYIISKILYYFELVRNLGIFVVSYKTLVEKLQISWDSWKGQSNHIFACIYSTQKYVLTSNKKSGKEIPKVFFWIQKNYVKVTIWFFG